MGQQLQLVIDHIDGDYHNNEASNLRFLCPNCHAQTESFAGRSKNKYAHVLPDRVTPSDEIGAAGVVELADTRSLGGRALGRGGSSPPSGTVGG